MITAVAFVIAAGAGTLARAEAGRRWNQPEGMAWGTMVVNVVGSFLLGLLHDVGPPEITVLGVAGLGAFTTFSSFARDAIARVEQQQLLRSVAYVAISCAAGIGALTAGIVLA